MIAVYHHLRDLAEPAVHALCLLGHLQRPGRCVIFAADSVLRTTKKP